ncbi:MAG: c-type cytochrome, partial [Burkholderiales bacterium]|nr:c-type cytochrome [Burkholderiales bacterium]
MTTLPTYPLAVPLLTLAALMSPAVIAADLEAGKAKVGTVCAACHGAAGISVSDAIPNLAGQRVAYLETQLKAWKDGSRKNPLMNAIAVQLSIDDIANVAAFFGSLPGANAASMKSDFLPNLAKTSVPFPEGYQGSFTKYHTINFPATRQVRYYFANPGAVLAAKAGKDLPNGAYLFAEVY